jgi:hypothetical protein
VVFAGIKTPIIITCKIHGDFIQVPDKHINAEQGCPKCKKSARKDLQFFIKKHQKFIIINMIILNHILQQCVII